MTSLSKPVRDFDERRERVKQREHGADQRKERAAFRIQAQARGTATRERVKTLRRQWLDGIGRVQVRWSFCMSTLSEFNILLARKLRIMLQQ